MLVRAVEQNRRLEDRVKFLEAELQRRESYQPWRRQLWLQAYLARLEFEDANPDRAERAASLTPPTFSTTR